MKDRKIILLLDNDVIQLKQKVLLPVKIINILPARVASLSQPMDQVLFRLKDITAEEVS